MFGFIFNFQKIVTDQQTGQKIQIVTALEPSSPGKQQFILANAEYSPGGKVILTKQEGTSNKVILAAPDGSGVNQLLFASPDLAGQQIQVLPWDICVLLMSSSIKKLRIKTPWMMGFFFKICPVFVFQFVTDGSDQSVLKPIVEYCVVCGDKASGKKHKPNKNRALCPVNTDTAWLFFVQHLYVYVFK